MSLQGSRPKQCVHKLSITKFDSRSPFSFYININPRYYFRYENVTSKYLADVRLSIKSRVKRKHKNTSISVILLCTIVKHERKRIFFML